MILEQPQLLHYESFPDSRGIFKPILVNNFNPHQISIVQSKENVVRGLHAQTGIHQQAKILYVLRGRIRDVIISPLDGTQWHFDLEPGEGLFIPRYCLHGYAAIEQSEVLYLVDAPYNPTKEWGIHPLDKSINVDWGVDKPIISDKDQKLPTYLEWLTHDKD